MWGGGVLSLVRQGRLWRRPRHRTARVADESAPGDGVGGVAAQEAVDDPAGAPPAATPLARAHAVLAMARGAVRLDGGGGAEEEWAAATGWRPARAAGDEVGRLVARESLRYVIYA